MDTEQKLFKIQNVFDCCNKRGPKGPWLHKKPERQKKEKPVIENNKPGRKRTISKEEAQRRERIRKEKFHYKEALSTFEQKVAKLEKKAVYYNKEALFIEKFDKIIDDYIRWKVDVTFSKLNKGSQNPQPSCQDLEHQLENTFETALETDPSKYI